jgi:hypothetical protein
VEFTFDVDGVPVKFARSWLSGRMSVIVDGKEQVLQAPTDISTSISVILKRQWPIKVKGREVIIEKERPLLMSAFRRHTYRIFIEGKLVLERRGF